MSPSDYDERRLKKSISINEVAVNMKVFWRNTFHIHCGAPICFKSIHSQPSLAVIDSDGKNRATRF